MQESLELPGKPADPDPRWFGRRVAYDLRDAAYRASAFPILKPRASAGVTSRYWNLGPTLDQGPTPRCVAFSWLTFLGAGPVTNRKSLPDVQFVYDEAQRSDEFSDTPPEGGTSVRAGANVLRGLGYVPSYLWADSVRQGADWVLQKGPILAGSVWPDSMFDPDPQGFLQVDLGSTFDGAHANGHAYCLVGCSLTKKCPDGTKGAFYIQQTWGEWGLTKWGQTGIALLPFSGAEVLWAAGGMELCLPTELKVKPKL